MRTTIVVLLSLASVGVYATVPISAYEEFRAEPFMESYLWGVSSGFLTAAAISEEKGIEPLFCVPPDVAISNEDSVAIFEKELYDKEGSIKHPAHTPISLVFLLAMENLYPCEMSEDENPNSEESS
jgi:hypothetical protein